MSTMFFPLQFSTLNTCETDRPSEPMGPDDLFVSQRTGSHSAGIQVQFTNCFVCRWFCLVHDPKPPCHSHNWLSFGKFQDTERFLIHCERHFSSRLPPSGWSWKYLKAPSTKKTWRDSLTIDMLLSAVSVLVVAQSSLEIPEGLMNNPVYLHMRSSADQTLTWELWKGSGEGLQQPAERK